MSTKSERPVIYVAGGYASGFVAQAIKDEAERTGARVIGRLDLPRTAKPIAPAMLAAIMNDPDAVAPADAERAREIIALRLASPKRASAGKPIEQQQDAAHLPLFVHANEPKLF
jgi:hypothetical protein